MGGGTEWWWWGGESEEEEENLEDPAGGERKGNTSICFHNSFSSLLCWRDVGKGREVKNCGRSFNYPLCIDTGKWDLLHWHSDELKLHTHTHPRKHTRTHTWFSSCFSSQTWTLVDAQINKGELPTNTSWSIITSSHKHPFFQLSAQWKS